jgi:putative glycerol-1-phosphate prenyltransferase
MPEKKPSNIYRDIFCSVKKKIAVLIDPDKHNPPSLKKIIGLSDASGIDFFMVGGSLLREPVNHTIDLIKKSTTKPLILFPGNLLQLSDKVDAVLLLSLISGRNPELLIGNHVIAAPFIKKTGIETIPTGYILIGTGKTSSVEYISNTVPIPSDKVEIAVATAIAGEQLGHKLIYLEAGSGAMEPVPSKMIKEVRTNISIPLVVGGGIRTEKAITDACKSGADVIVIGNILEERADLISAFVKAVHNF